MIDLLAEKALYFAQVMGQDPRVRFVFQRLDIEWTPLGTTGGDCAGTHIRLNPAATDEHQRTTLGHEIAHALDHEIFGGRGHGYGWSFWMRKLGLPVEQFHDNEELIKLHPGAVYRIVCTDCDASMLRTFVPTCCQDRECKSTRIRIKRDGIGGTK